MKKFVSGATCAAGPALMWWADILWVAFPGGGGLGAAAPNYKINVMPVQPDAASDSWSFERLLVLENETTTEQPSLTYYGGKLWLAWTGTDPAHRLNLMPLTITADSHLVPGQKIVLDWTATGGPSLIEYDAKLYLAFSGGGGLGGGKPNGALNIAWSSSGNSWPSSQLTVLNQFHSLLSPSLAILPQRNPPSLLFIAFTGTNHLLYLASFNGPGPSYLQELKGGHADYAETSDFAPSLGLYFASTKSLGDLFYVWTGSGTNRHLYRITSVGSGETIQEHDAYSETSAFSPGVFGVEALQYVAWAGTDAAHRLNIGELSSLTKIEGP
jgi:hypothetical protein